MTQPSYRNLRFGITRVELREGENDVRYLRAEQPLVAYSQRITDRLKLWAATRPEQTFMARRARLADGSTGDWMHLTYAQAWQSARSIAQALLDRGLNVERPVLILSENDLEHAQLALGCLVAGVPFVPTSPAYSLISQDYDKLRHVARTPNATPRRLPPWAQTWRWC
jgi:feruloyl-CoA synthase